MKFKKFISIISCLIVWTMICDYFVVKNDQNHFPIRSVNANSSTSENAVKGFNQSLDSANKEAIMHTGLGKGCFAMVSGDLDSNGIVEGADKTNTDFLINVGSSGYSQLDLNMNSTIGSDDLNTFYGNVGKSD